MKKILFYISTLLCLFLFFLFGGKCISTLAYFENSNTIGTYPVKLDIDNYNTENKLIINDIPRTTRNNVEYYSSNGTIYINGTSTAGFTINLTNYTNVSMIPYNYGDYITLQSFTSGSCTSSARCIEYNLSTNTTGYFLQSSYVTGDYDNSNKWPNKIINSDLESLKLYIQSGNYIDFQINIMILVSNVSGYHLDEYVPPLKFGNRVGYQVNLYNPTSNNISTKVLINNYNKLVVDRNITINANSYYELIGNITINSSGTNDNTFFLPYNIDSDGTISIDYKLSIIIQNTNVLIKSDENIGNDTYFYFEPVFSGYYKGESTNNLYFKNSYTFNSITYVGFSSNGQDLNSILFPCVGDDGKYCIQDSLFVNTNSNVNVLANNVITTGNRNNINFNEVFLYNYTNSFGINWTDTLFSFQLNIGNTNDSINSGVEYSINVSNISLSVINDSSTSSPLPNNPNTINKYNSCDAWYDIPCQLGNAVTYVIYEAPIISPVLTFIVSFITMFSSLVSFVELFRTFGIVFGCFVIYMFIELLYKYSK